MEAFIKKAAADGKNDMPELKGIASYLDYAGYPLFPTPETAYLLLPSLYFGFDVAVTMAIALMMIATSDSMANILFLVLFGIFVFFASYNFFVPPYVQALFNLGLHTCAIDA